MAVTSPDIRRQSKKVVYSVYNYLKDLVTNRPNATIHEVFKETQIATAQACSMTLRTVQRIVAEGNQRPVVCQLLNGVEDAGPSFESPKKKKPHVKRVTGLDDYNKDIVRRTVFEFYDRGEYPTCKKVRDVLFQKIGFVGSTDSVWKMLKNVGFSYKKCNDGRHFLMERGDIVASRIAFLRKMHNLKAASSPRPIIYLDETWINQNHSKQHIWQHSTRKGGLRVPVGKGSRLIICHAGCSQHGFLEGAQLVFQSKSKVDYHQEMNADVFKEWFVDMLNSLEEGCVIVMDNASYHSKLIESIPNTKTKKADITFWLTEKGIRHDPTHTVKELLAIVQAHKHNFITRYELDEIALEMGHEVVRLPPYHCQYNPIELIWAQVKGEVAATNKTFKIKDVRVLLEQALRNVTVENWQKCVEHAEKLQAADFIREGVRDEIIQRIVINLEEDSDDSEYSYGAEEHDAL